MTTTAKIQSSRPLPYTNLVKQKYWRFRHRKLGNFPLPGQPGDPEFHREYAKLLDQLKRWKPDKPTNDNTLRWLALQYERSPEYRLRADATQRDYSRVLAYIVDKVGNVPYRAITPAGVIALRNTKADKLRAANYIVQVMSLLLSWAVSQGLLTENPVLGTKLLKHKKGTKKSYKPWEEEDIDVLLVRGRQQVVDAVIGGLWTGQRLRDVVRMDMSQTRFGRVSLQQSKTDTQIDLPIAPALADVIDHRPTSESTRVFLREDGTPWPSEGALSNALKIEVRRLGLDDRYSFHGLRFATAARLESLGLTIGPISSIIGHETYRLAMEYATRRRNATMGMTALSENYPEKVKTS